MRPRVHLPSTTVLRIFESTARHLSFTRAADELFLTQSAMAFAHFIAGRDAEAAAWAAMALRLKPHWLPALRMALASNAMQGRREEAAQALAVYTEIDPEISIGKICDCYPFQRAADRERLSEGLRKAGLPQ